MGYKSIFKEKDFLKQNIIKESKNFENEINEIVLKAISFYSKIPSQAYDFYLNISKKIKSSVLPLRAIASDLIEYHDIKKSDDWKKRIFNSLAFNIMHSISSELVKNKKNKELEDLLNKFKKIMNNENDLEKFLANIYKNLNQIKNKNDLFNIIREY